MIKVKIKLLSGGKMPEKKTAGAAAFDCYAREDVTIGDSAVLIPLGFALELPPGYVAKLVPRSSIGLKSPLRQPNCVGIIDDDFRGELHAMYENKYSDGEWHVAAGERICQMLIEKVEPVELIQVDELSGTERGESGFGSTGR